MKAIPEQLRAYFPKAADPARPWWEGPSTTYLDLPLPRAAVWFRPTRGDVQAIRIEADPAQSQVQRIARDAANPLQPPPILVGQVWALQVPGSPLRVGTVTHTWQDAIVTVGLSGFGMNLRGNLLLESGFLLACPYGYAPWSGPEVP